MCKVANHHQRRIKANAAIDRMRLSAYNSSALVGQLITESQKTEKGHICA
ncbi:hypothetical protein [Hydromonas duriensis]|uniref:Uncharacterized protein n=1 Tax=Hydromonas duriensis TaxID=1527608 RepID=A0A4R6Y944_9BURK|nr:hypothetical protein [Hydromonas duriensis]TDR31960.1 hypothetical protein DFR44_10623 [Hydromonas duriensis]